MKIENGTHIPYLRSVYRSLYWSVLHPLRQKVFLHVSTLTDPAKLKLIEAIMPYSMVGLPRLLNTYDLARDIEKKNITGAFVECGVWNGGCAGLMAKVSQIAGSGRMVWLFDSFEGLPEPRAEDGELARSYASNRASGALDSIDQCVGDRAIVERLLFETLGVDRHRVKIRQGWFQETVIKARNEVGGIALLRLDGDWYESTKVCLEAFFDQIVPGGYLILDDYGYWEGCRRATDEFLQERGITESLKMVDDSGAFLRKS